MVVLGGRGGCCAARCPRYPGRFCDGNACPPALPVAEVPAAMGTGGCAVSGGALLRCHALLLQEKTHPRAQELGWLLLGLRLERWVVDIACMSGTRWSKGRSCLWEERGAGVWHVGV